MSGHLCLKWNNHSSAFIKNISIIQAKEKYCDATIACQGKYFPVHRMILSTCSDYFDEMFERIKCPHPYIVFKDIEPGEMELLLNYMYQGEVNVVQEKLPTLIKAAEALKIKGLAVPDDLPSKESSKKRSSTDDHSQPKSRRRRRHSSQSELPTDGITESASDNYPMEPSHTDNLSALGQLVDSNEPRFIKEEPIDTYGDGGSSGASNSIPPLHSEHDSVGKEENVFVDFPIAEESSSYVKSENNSQEQPYDDQSSSWADYSSGNVLPQPEMSAQDDIFSMCPGSRETVEIVHSPMNQKNRANILKKGSTFKLHHCMFCDYKTRYTSHLESHVNGRHTGEKPFVCHLCGKNFSQKSHLTCHLLRKNKCTEN